MFFEHSGYWQRPSFNIWHKVCLRITNRQCDLHHIFGYDHCNLTTVLGESSPRDFVFGHPIRNNNATTKMVGETTSAQLLNKCWPRQDSWIKYLTQLRRSYTNKLLVSYVHPQKELKFHNHTKHGLKYNSMYLVLNLLQMTEIQKWNTACISWE
jgi:hypothetical protein